MKPNEITQDWNRRDFLKGSSFAAMMVAMGGVPLHAADPAKTETKEETKYSSAEEPMNVGLIGCGNWGKEILTTLAKMPIAPVVAICDSYPAFLKRAGEQLAPKAERYPEYQKLLENKEVKGVIVATPSHQHKEIVLAALAAGKHVYCEAPLATTMDDARVIAKAAQANLKLNFQTGLQTRSDAQVRFLANFVRTGVLGKAAALRAQYHKKQTWRRTSPNPDREKDLNWRLEKDVSLGLIGEIGIHQVDLANWYLLGLPTAVTGFGSIQHPDNKADGRQVADTIVTVFEYPGGAMLNYDATLANSFDGEYGMLYGTDSAIMMRERRAWMFKEVDAPLLGWEVYARKENFYKESGVVLGMDATKNTPAKKDTDSSGQAVVDVKSALQYAFESFIANSNAITSAYDDFAASFNVNDAAALKSYMANIFKAKAASAGYKEGYEAAVCAIKANEAVVKSQKIVFAKEWFALA